MKSARLIKRHEMQPTAKAEPPRCTARPVSAASRQRVSSWVTERQVEHPSPRAAFAALFAPAGLRAR